MVLCDNDQRMTINNRFLFFVGVAMTNFLDVTVNTNYENASAGVSEMICPEVSFRVEGLLIDNILACHAEAGIMPVAAVMRPGYSYIDNYTASQPVLASLFDDYQWHVKPLAGASADVGLDLTVGAGNRISLSYLWCYHTSGDADIWRFDHATHLVAVDLYINHSGSNKKRMS